MAICIVCKQKVTQKTGIRCQGSCSAWVHYGCLDYVTDDGRKMVHEPYNDGHMYSDVCVVTQMSDKDKQNLWNNNYDLLSNQYENMNETASQVTQETATKSVCQGASIHKSLSLGMCSWAETSYFGYSPRPLEYIPCGNVPHILLPTPFPIQYFPTTNQYGENPNKVNALNVRRGYNGMKTHERPGKRFSPTSTATETDDYNIVPLNSHKRNYPAVSYIEPNSHSKSNIHDLHYLHTSQHMVGSYRSSIPLYHLNSSTVRPNLRHASTEVSDIGYFNSYNYSDYLDLNHRKSHLYDSKSITTVGATETYENVYGRKMLSTNLLSLSDSFNNTLLNSADLATLNAIKYNVTGMHKWTSSVKQNKKNESDTLLKNNSVAIAADRKEPLRPRQGSVLPDISESENQKSSIIAKIKVSIKQSKSNPLHASPQAKLPTDHLRINKSVAVVTDKMVENVPLEAECQTSILQTLSEVKNHAAKSTNTSKENSVAPLLTKAVGSCDSKCCPPVGLKISNMATQDKALNNSLANSDAPPDEKSKVAKKENYKNVSAGNSITNPDAFVCPDKQREIPIYKKSENLSTGHIYPWTKLDASELPDGISKQELNKIFGKLLSGNKKNLNPEESDDSSSENVLTSCMKNVLSTFEMLSSQICDIFYNRKKEHVATYCSTVRSEGVISIVRKNNASSNVFEKKHECLTVKVINFNS